MTGSDFIGLRVQTPEITPSLKVLLHVSLVIGQISDFIALRASIESSFDRYPKNSQIVPAIKRPLFALWPHGLIRLQSNDQWLSLAMGGPRFPPAHTVRHATQQNGKYLEMSEFSLPLEL